MVLTLPTSSGSILISLYLCEFGDPIHFFFSLVSKNGLSIKFGEGTCVFLQLKCGYEIPL